MGSAGLVTLTRSSVLIAAGATVLASSCSLSGDPVQKRWESRVPSASCGKVTLTHSDQFEQVASEGIKCLRSALRLGKTAELSLTFPTVEGDTIRTYYRLTPEGALELYEDTTADKFGPQKWTFTECYRPEWLPQISCSP